MNPGVVSLRCPACARPFLSLPLQRESPVTCPHCQRQGTAGSYAAAGAAPGEALVQSLKQRVLQPGGPQPQPRPPAAGGSPWPVAPPVFSSPARKPPLTAAEPQWPFFPSEIEEPASPFTGLGLPGRQHAQVGDEELDSLLPERSERNVPLGIFLLVLVIAGLWVAWQTLQPPLAVEIPAVPPVTGPPTALDRAHLEEAAAAAAFGESASGASDTSNYPPILAR